jgi:branched-chain amino acid transport system ATP-binding protein
LAREAPLLAMRNVSARYGSVRVLDQINLTVRDGECLAVLGANGAGKTTLLRAISGLMVQRSGEIVFDDVVITRQSSHRIVRLGIAQVAEGRHLFPSLTVEENLEMGGYVPCTSGRSAEVLDTFALVLRLFPRLGERRRQLARTLSGGEQQMLAIGRALMTRPKLMLLDEPSVGLAPQVVADLLHALRALKTIGLAVILAEQNVPLALGLADRVVALRLGRIALEGDAAEVAQGDQIRNVYLGSAKVSS